VRLFSFHPKARLIAIVAGAAIVAACASGQKNPTPGQVDADKFLYTRGTELLAKKNWITAREYFRRIVDSYPQSIFRADAKLGVGDSYLGENHVDTLILAVNEFREFLQYFPLNPRADYAQYRLALAQSKQMLNAERDQTATLETLRELQKFNENYPNSQYKPEVDKIYRHARDRLSESEFKIGMVYFRAKYMIGALPRFTNILKDDPGYTKKDQVYFFSGEACMRAGLNPQAVQMYETLIAEFPKSRYSKQAKRRLDTMAKAAAAAEKAGVGKAGGPGKTGADLRR
jgi:outer membrane protein assembly factor BamD